MKKQISSWITLIVLVALGAAVYIYGNKPSAPAVGEDGKISGDYSIAGVMRLGKPYVCTFEKSDGSSSVMGVIHTDGQKIYGEFRIETKTTEAEEFNSFLVMGDGEAYVWSSLQNIGYKSKAAESASKGASPAEQGQIIGLRDKIPYKCSPWQDVDSAIFEPPTWVTFSELGV